MRAALVIALCAGWLVGQSEQAPIEALLRDLDERFERGDVPGYLGRFEPDNRGAVAMLGRNLARQVQASRSRKRTSRVLVGPTEIGGRTVFRVRHDVALLTKKGARRALTEDTYLAVRVDGAALTPTFSVEMLPEMDCVQSNKFKCPACNYEIGGVEGFLCVPLRAERTLALESASFYLIGTDVVCDVHVQVQPAPEAAQVVARRLADAFVEVADQGEVGLVTEWRPPVHAAAPPDGMDSARVSVRLPGDDDAGDRAVFHVVTFGGLQHVLLTRGSADVLTSHQGALDALYRSYMLLEDDRDLAEAAALPLRHHLGSSFDGARYDNQRYGVTFAGPDGWRTEHRVGGAKFRVRWSAPDGSQVWLNGYGVPPGLESWTEPDADRWIDYRLRTVGLRPLPEQPAGVDPAWHASPSGAKARTLVLELPDPDSPAQPKRRVLHVQLHPDLLLVVDGYGASAEAERALLSTLPSLARKP